MLLYLHGFASGPSSHKARVLSERFRAIGVPMEVPDLTPGDDGFERSTPSSMLAIAEGLLSAAPPPHAIIGSSLGGYLAAVIASRSPVERLVLLAPAFRLFERWGARLTEAQRADWKANGLETMHFASNRKRRIGWQFFEDAARFPAIPEVRIPTLCLAGTRDDTVPYADVESFVARTPGARLVALDDAHELIASLDRIFDEARAFLAPFTSARAPR